MSPVRIDDQGFIRKLARILQARGGRGYPVNAISEAVLAITIPGDQVLSQLQRFSIENLATDVVESDGEATLITIAQNATATQLNLSLGDGMNNQELADLVGFDLWMKLNTFNAGDRAEGLFAFETGIRGAFPVTGARNIGQLRRGRLWVAIDTDRLVDRVQVVFPTPYRLTKISSTVANPLAHFQVTNRRSAVGTVDVTIGGAVYFVPVV